MSSYEAHPRVFDDLADIEDFIAEDNPAAAARVINEILTAIDDLIPFPGQGHRRPDLASLPVRFWRVYDYLMATRLTSRPLWVRCGLSPFCTEVVTPASWRPF